MEINDTLNNVDNITDTIIITKPRDKKTKFIKERAEIITKLKELIGLNETKNTVFLYELENNQKLKIQIELEVGNIKKYYKCGTWGYFSKDAKKGSGNYINLIRAVFIDDGYDIHSKDKITEFNNIKKRYKLLTFIKNT
jgi:hypothetical protein